MPSAPIPFWRSAMTGNVLAVIAFLIVSLDAPVARMMRDLDPWLADLFRVLTKSGDAKWYLIPAGLALLAAALARRLLARRRAREVAGWCAAAAAYLFVAVAGSCILVNLVKVLFGRARPVLLDAEGAAGFHPLSFDAKFHSFPSGHANTLIVVGLVAASFWPRQRAWILALAVALALTRVGVNAHFLSDVVAGGALGALTTAWLCAWLTARGWVFERDRRGRRRLRAPGRWLRRLAGRITRLGRSRPDVRPGGAR